MKYVSIDLETTGLDADNHQILEFGAIIEDTNNIIPFEKLPTFHAYIVPDGYIVGDVYALDLNKDIINKIKNRKELADEYQFLKNDELASVFLAWLHTHGFEIKQQYYNSDSYNYTTINVAGKNFNGFDRKFLNNVPDFNKLIRIRTRTIDPSIFYVDWNNDKCLPTLDDCKIRCNLDGVVAHTAVEDAMDVIQLLRPKYN